MHSKRNFSSFLSMLNSKYPPEWTQFDIMWNEASEEQKDIIRAQYSELQKKDWRTLSIEQLQNCYTITYGCPESEVFRKRDKILVFLGTSAAIASGVGLYYFLRLFGKFLKIYSYC